MTVKVVDNKSKKYGNAEFSKWLVTAREARGLTRGELATELGVSYPMVSQMETGYRKPSTTVIMALRTVLDVSADDIYAVLYPPTMIEETATMSMLRNAFTKHPKLVNPEDRAKAEVASIKVDGQDMELVLTDGTSILLTVDRRETVV